MADIQRYGDLFDEVLNELRKGFWVRPFSFPLAGELERRLRIDVKEDEKSYTVHADLPGVKKEDVQIDIDGDQVSIRAETKREKEEKKGEKLIYSERAYGMVARTFTLPTDVDAQGAKASFKDGVLELVLPKKVSAQARRITVG